MGAATGAHGVALAPEGSAQRDLGRQSYPTVTRSDFPYPQERQVSHDLAIAERGQALMVSATATLRMCLFTKMPMNGSQLLPNLYPLGMPTSGQCDLTVGQLWCSLEP
jgi:hypothetical protein